MKTFRDHYGNMLPNSFQVPKQSENPTTKWLDVYGYEGIYIVSSCGLVKSIDRKVPHPRSKKGFHLRKGKLISFNTSANGYLRAVLCKHGEEKGHSIHRIVATAFIENPKNKKEVNHIDGDKSNNRVSNLEWVTSLENKKHSVRNRFNAFGERHGRSKLKSSEVESIRKMIDEGVFIKDIANMFGVHRETIGRIKRGKAWIR